MNTTMRSLGLLTTAGVLLILGSSSQSEVVARTNWHDVRTALDTNRDGTVSAEELDDLRAAAELILQICNNDTDPRLSLVELVEVREIASKANANQDEYVDRKELDQWLVAWRNTLSQEAQDQVQPASQPQSQQASKPGDKADQTDDKARQTGSEKDQTVDPKDTPKDKGRVSLKTVLDVKKNGFTDFDIANLNAARKRIMARFDLNDDKKLSAAELEPIQESLRDEDADGKGVTISELTDWLVEWRKQLANPMEPANAASASKPNPKQDPKPKGISLTMLLDLKKNGLTSFDLANESKAAQRVMDKLDLDKNSILSPSETADVVEPLAEADVDNNGVSRSELIDWIIAWRKELD